MLDYAADPAAAFALLVPNVAFFSGIVVGFIIRDQTSTLPRRPLWEVVGQPQLAFFMLCNNCCLGFASYVVSDFEHKLCFFTYGLTLTMLALLNPISQRAGPKWATAAAGITTLFSSLTCFFFSRVDPLAGALTVPHLIFMTLSLLGSYSLTRLSSDKDEKKKDNVFADEN